MRETLSAVHCDLEGEHMGERDSLCTAHCDQWVREGGEHTGERDSLYIVIRRRGSRVSI